MMGRTFLIGSIFLATLASTLGPGSALAADPRFQQVAPLPPSTPVPAIERLGLETTECFGSCPAFSVVIAADGSFRYEGKANVERLGEHSGRVGRAALDLIMRYVGEIAFDELEPVYPAPFTDYQTTYVMVDYGAVQRGAGDDAVVRSPGGVKVVENQGRQAPAVVWALERLIVDLLEDAVWN